MYYSHGFCTYINNTEALYWGIYVVASAWIKKAFIMYSTYLTDASTI